VNRCELRLSEIEREEISRGLIAGKSLRAIARELGRQPSTISREVKNNGGSGAYRAIWAEARAQRLAHRPKVAKLANNPALRSVVEQGLKNFWSPQLIADKLRDDYPDVPEMWVSHETIYQSLFIQSRGALKKELAACLRTGRAQRRSRKERAGKGRLVNMINISERPAEAADRAVPGHWEGDLIIGKDGNVRKVLIGAGQDETIHKEVAAALAGN
jgi:IS30 family transposase